MLEEQDPFENELNPEAFGTILTLEEVQIAVSWLKRRFPQFSVQYIVQSLDQYNYQKQQGLIPRNHPHHQPQPKRELNPPERVNLISNKVQTKESAQERKVKDQQNLRLICRLFCEGGENYSQARRYIPELSQTQYRNMLLTIAGTTLKQIIRSLKRQCNIEIKELSEAQKVTIKTAIISAHEWMGRKSVEAIETLFKFITKKFIDRHKMISKDQTIQLYSIIQQRVSNQSLDLVCLEPENQFREEVQQLSCSLPSQLLENDDQKELLTIVGKSFLELLNPQKISNFLSKKYGLHKRWDKASIEEYFKMIIEKSIQKLRSSSKKGKVMLQNIRTNEKNIQKILEEPHKNLQYALVQLYLSEMPSKEQMQSLLQQLSSLIDSAKPLSDHSKSLAEESQPSAESSECSDELESEVEHKSQPQNSEKVLHPNRIVEDIFEVDNKPQWRKQPEKKSRKEKPTMKMEEVNEDLLYFDE